MRSRRFLPRKYFARFLFLLCIGLFGFGCGETPSPVGTNLLPNNFKVVLDTLDSRNPGDSVLLSSRQVTTHVPTGGATEMLLGRSGPIEARMLYKLASNVDTTLFTTLLPAHPLQSAYLLVKVGNYRYGDTSATMQLSCTINEILTQYQTGATWDSLGQAFNYGPAVGTFTGTIGISDTMFKIPIDTAFVQRLLHYIGFDSLSTHFQGIALLPQSGTDGITGIKPGGVELHYVLQQDTLPDTIVMQHIQSLYIANSTEVDPSNRMVMQSGITKRPYLMVAIPKLPKLSTVNSAVLDLTMDPAGLRHGKDLYLDTNNISLIDTIYMYCATGDSSFGTYRSVGNRLPGSNVYEFTLLRDYVELWKHGAVNYGMTPVQSINDVTDGVSTVDRFLFYPPSATDSTLRPHLRIVYSTIPK